MHQENATYEGSLPSLPTCLACLKIVPPGHTHGLPINENICINNEVPRGRSLPVTGLASQSVVGGPPHMHTRSCNMIGAPAPPHMHTMHTRCRRCSILGAPAPPYMHTSRSCNMLGASALTTHAYQEMQHAWRTCPHHTCMPGAATSLAPPPPPHMHTRSTVTGKSTLH